MVREQVGQGEPVAREPHHQVVRELEARLLCCPSTVSKRPVLIRKVEGELAYCRLYLANRAKITTSTPFQFRRYSCVFATPRCVLISRPFLRLRSTAKYPTDGAAKLDTKQPQVDPTPMRRRKASKEDSFNPRRIGLLRRLRLPFFATFVLLTIIAIGLFLSREPRVELRTCARAPGTTVINIGTDRRPIPSKKPLGYEVLVANLQISNWSRILAFSFDYILLSDEKGRTTALTSHGDQYGISHHESTEKARDWADRNHAVSFQIQPNSRDKYVIRTKIPAKEGTNQLRLSFYKDGDKIDGPYAMECQLPKKIPSPTKTTYGYKVTKFERPPYYRGTMPLNYTVVQTPPMGFSLGAEPRTLAFEFETFRNTFRYDGGDIEEAQTTDRNGNVLARATVQFFIDHDEHGIPLQGIELHEIHFGRDGREVYSCKSRIDSDTGFKVKEHDVSGTKENEYFFLWPR